MVTAVGICSEALGPLRHPPNRPTEPFRCPQNYRHLHIKEGFGAEATTDIGHDDANLMFRNEQCVPRDPLAIPVRHLAGNVEGIAIAYPIVVRCVTTVFHCRAGHPVADQGQFGDMVCGRDRLLGVFFVSQTPFLRLIGTELLVDQDSIALKRSAGVNDCRQRFIVDHHSFGAIHRLEPGFGNDTGDIVADVTHAILRKDRARRLVHGPALVEINRVNNWKNAEFVGLPVGTGQYSENAGQFGRGSGINRLNARVRMGTVDEGGVCSAGQFDIINIIALAA